MKLKFVVKILILIVVGFLAVGNVFASSLVDTFTNRQDWEDALAARGLVRSSVVDFNNFVEDAPFGEGTTGLRFEAIILTTVGPQPFLGRTQFIDVAPFEDSNVSDIDGTALAKMTVAFNTGDGGRSSVNMLLITTGNAAWGADFTSVGDRLNLLIVGPGFPIIGTGGGNFTSGEIIEVPPGVSFFGVILKEFPTEGGIRSVEFSSRFENVNESETFGVDNISLATPSQQVINNFVSFQPIESTFKTTSDTVGCFVCVTSEVPFVGQFSFDARLSNTSNKSFTNLVVEVTELTNGNVLNKSFSNLERQGTSKGPSDVGARLTVRSRSLTDDYIDSILAPGDFVDVHFDICLKEESSFRFFVNVLGIEKTGGTDSLQVAKYQSTSTEPKRVKFRKGSGIHGKGFFGRFRPRISKD